jgi:hypothetical protein
VTRNTALKLVALLVLLATLLVVTIVPGSSVFDWNVDVGTKVLAFYVAYLVSAALTAPLMNVFINRCTREHVKA